MPIFAKLHFFLHVPIGDVELTEKKQDVSTSIRLLIQNCESNTPLESINHHQCKFGEGSTDT